MFHWKITFIAVPVALLSLLLVPLAVGAVGGGDALAGLVEAFKAVVNLYQAYLGAL